MVCHPVWFNACNWVVPVEVHPKLGSQRASLWELTLDVRYECTSPLVVSDTWVDGGDGWKQHLHWVY
jgi:hypothetical protein